MPGNSQYHHLSQRYPFLPSPPHRTLKISMEDRDVRRIALFIAVLAGFLAPFDISAVNIALPTIGAEFSLDASPGSTRPSPGGG